MNITSEREIMIFRREGNFGAMYSCAVSEKQQDGTYLQAYIPVWFRKGVELANKSMIKITKAWLKPTKDMKIVLFISEYEQKCEVVENDNKGFEGNKLYLDEITLDDTSDLPF